MTSDNRQKKSIIDFFWRLSDVLECSANTSCHLAVSNLGWNYRNAMLALLHFRSLQWLHLQAVAQYGHGQNVLIPLTRP